MRRRRHVISGKPYEVIMRTRVWLPFNLSIYMTMLLNGILARTLRDEKVNIHALVWMGNHLHIILTPFDPQKLADFCCELQKKITEAIKSLLGVERLNLWEGRPTQILIADLPAAISKFIYVYNNPVVQFLTPCIDQYRGINTWNDFTKAGNDLDAEITHEAGWTRYRDIPKLPACKMTADIDKRFSAKLKGLAIKHKYRIHPNRWMKAFGVTSPEEVAEVNRQIKERVEYLQQEAAAKRAEEVRKIASYKSLAYRPIISDYRPQRKPSERKVFIYCSNNALRCRLIAEHNMLCEQCYQCYIDALAGKKVLWPPGVFKPPMRSDSSAVRF